MILRPGNKITMSYNSYQVDILEKSHIILVGGPEDIPFIKPANISNIDQLRKLVKIFKTGDAYWRPQTKSEKKRTDEAVKQREAAGILAKPPRDTRCDNGGKHKKRKAADTSN